MKVIKVQILFLLSFVSVLYTTFSLRYVPNKHQLQFRRSSLGESTRRVDDIVDTRFFYSKKSFQEVGLKDKVMGTVLRDLKLERPSKIQALAFQEVLQGTTCIVADQTGSGKTLAYLLPLCQRVVELTRNGTVPSAPPRAPHVVIVTPTTELAEQTGTVVRSLAASLKFKSLCLTSFSDMDRAQKNLRVGVDVLIATPGRLLALLKRKEIILDRLQSIVFDETDVLFLDESFSLQPIGAACPQNTQFLFVTATLPDVVTKQILLEFPEARELTGPGLHRISPSVEEELIDCSIPESQRLLSKSRRDITANQDKIFENKRRALLKALDENPVPRTLIFCNSIQQCRNVENALTRIDKTGRLRQVLAYHGAIDGRIRDDNVKNFGKPLLQKPVVLVSTDRASRGMDFSRSPVDHCILFDFPQEPSEYVRRVGRTGRAGRPGKATVLVYGRQVGVAKRVLLASIEGKRIDPVHELHIGGPENTFLDDSESLHNRKRNDRYSPSRGKQSIQPRAGRRR
jgi:ATP-dependent RNA helicase DDX18/HAS1